LAYSGRMCQGGVAIVFLGWVWGRRSAGAHITSNRIPHETPLLGWKKEVFPPSIRNPKWKNKTPGTETVSQPLGIQMFPSPVFVLTLLTVHWREQKTIRTSFLVFVALVREPLSIVRPPIVFDTV